MANTFTKAAVEVKQSFTSTMNYYSRFTDSDQEWLIMNNETNFKLGGTDVSVNDTETPTITSENQSLIRTVWFLAPFDMIVSNISGILMDDDFSNHGSTYYIGIWVMAGFGSSGQTPTTETGTVTLTLKYITQPFVSGVGLTSDDYPVGFYDPSPNMTLSAGDAVWAGHLQKRFDGNDDMTLTMTLCGQKINA